MLLRLPRLSIPVKLASIIILCLLHPRSSRFNVVRVEDDNKMTDAGKSKTLAFIVSVLVLICSLKWLLRWRPVVDHSMKKVKEMAQQKSSIIPIEKHYTANQPAKTMVTRRVPVRKHTLSKRMINTPLTNIFVRTKTSRSTSKARPPIKKKTEKDNIINRMFLSLGKKRSTSRVHPVGKVEDHCIDEKIWRCTNLNRTLL